MFTRTALGTKEANANYRMLIFTLASRRWQDLLTGVPLFTGLKRLNARASQLRLRSQRDECSNDCSPARLRINLELSTD
jgi:hypothetical protein